MNTNSQEKTLPDGSILKLVTWVSDHIRPGRKMHQLRLVDGVVTLGHPPDFENFSKAEICKMYHGINSSGEFTELLKTAAS